MLLWACTIFHTALSVDLDLRGKPATQSSDYYAKCRGDQWWRVDLEAAYCLTSITIVNRNYQGWRLTSAVVRAGLSQVHSQNTQIGDAVTRTQATNGAVIDFTSNPAISARYVSVELSGNCLHMAEVRISTEDVITRIMPTNVDATGMTVNWSTVPCADNYSVQYALTNRDNCVNISSPSYSSPCNMCKRNMTTINSLMPNSGYTVRVKAHVYGAYGPIKTVIVTTASSAPTGPPTSVTPGSQAQRSIAFSWSLPACGSRGGAITGYDYRLSTSGAAPMTGQTTAGLSVTIDGLTPYTSYSFQVAARTNDGTGPYSVVVTSTTQEAAPTVPLDVRILSIDYMSVSLGWSEPDPPNGRITHYNVRYWRSGDMGNMLTDTNVVALMHRVTGLATSVRAVTFPGPGPWSDPTEAMTSIGVPGPVQDLNVTVRTETSITLSWIPPLQPGGVITGYIVEYRILERPYQPDFTAEDTYKTNDAQHSPFTITNLEPVTKYEFRVLAKNEMFTGNEHRMLEVYTKPMTVQMPSASAAVIAAAVLGAIVFVLVLMIVIGCVVWKRQTRQNATNSYLVPTAMELGAKSTTHESDSPSAANPDGEIYEDVGLPSWARKLEIKWENMIIDDEILGKGNFGEVRAGGVRIRGRVTEAAIKTLKDNTSDAAVDFKAELQTMVGIKPHPNIVRLLGACFYEGILYVALEFLPNGNLRDYLRSIRPMQKGAGHSTDGASPVTSSNLLKFGTDVAKGMDHLSKTGIIHRDLAARNILLADDLTAKVSDFGLSRGEDIYVQKSSTRIPVRWLAIESLTRRVYKSKSDVWSFGILLWEIATYGSTPYPGIERKSLAERLLDGYRMPKPDNCADEIYNLMLKCWQEVPSKRPTFKVLYETLEKMNSKSYENVVLSPTVYENFIIKHEFDDN
ncbi:tyrosine-protein kinase receptor Tie-2-like [Patiria miniata]|uniref:receptor protein-tyrosine kinase n=1 Tax=Patiria miniata TaxID=46514 RepID=A0A914ARJ5_PATMI|nr:tyrosine-protein kinase receptor Tie-2-like [Patiria miniata]